MPGVLHHRDPAKGLDRVIEIWGEFRPSEPIVWSRLRALAALDPAVGKAVAERDLWRLQILAACSSVCCRRTNNTAPKCSISSAR